MDVSEPAVLLRRDGVIAEIVLNRPEVLNAMNMDWVVDLHQAVNAASKDDATEIVVVRGAGRAFCSGLDLKMLREKGMPPRFYPEQEDGFTALEAMDKLVIAQIHGYCLGGGIQLAIACDIRIACDDSVFGIPAPTEGLFPGMAVWRLPRMIGLGRAMRLAISGDSIDAAEALRIGLVDHVCPAEGFEEAARAVIGRYLKASQGAARATKRLMRSAFERDFASVYADSLPLLERCLSSAEVVAASVAWRRRQSDRKTGGDP